MQFRMLYRDDHRHPTKAVSPRMLIRIGESAHAHAKAYIKCPAFDLKMSKPPIIAVLMSSLALQLEQERRKSNGLVQALQREKEQHFNIQQQVNSISSPLMARLRPSVLG